jgi:rhodanese-related sulfurtransferase
MQKTTTAVKPAAKPIPTPKGKVITKDAFEKKFKEGSVQILNVLEPEGYSMGVIKGSIKIPLKSLPGRLSELDKATEIVAYCADTTCAASGKAAALLNEKGFKASAYEGGIKEWKTAGLPTD